MPLRPPGPCWRRWEANTESGPCRTPPPWHWGMPGGWPAAWSLFTPAAMASDSAGASPSSGPAAPGGAWITIQVNGEPRQCAAGLGLDEVLSSLGYRPQLVVVEFNGAILPRQCWAEQQVQESDCLEVVTIVGGGS